MAISGLVGWLGDLSRSGLASQRMYSALIENGPAVTYSWSQKRGLIFISSNAEALAGYSKREWEADFNGVVQQMLDPSDRTILGAAFESLQLHGRPMRATFRMRRRDGSLIWVDHNADCIESNGSDTTIQGTLIDVTARHEVADALELSKVARAESEAKSEFIAATSHELRTPLSSILGFAELLSGGEAPLDARQARYVANIRSAGEHLLAVINDLLDLSKIAADRVELTYEYINVLGAVRDAVAQVTPLSDQKGLAMRVLGDGELTIRADRRRLHQILLNLLSNAVKFTDDGEVKISSDLEDGAAAIRVSDSGLGIPAKSLASVFDEFVQLGSPERSQGGTGLGLPLSRRLARVMGGDITVASRLGRGSTFTLSLPVNDPNQKAMAPSADPSPGGDVGGARLGQPK
jgi:PAS domain S-box-containing protein